MANKSGTDLSIQVEDPKSAALAYVNQLGFEITGETPNMMSLEGRINRYIEQDPPLGPVLEVMDGDVGEANGGWSKAAARLSRMSRPS
jgi:hypothetical protein